MRVVEVVEVALVLLVTCDQSHFQQLSYFLSYAVRLKLSQTHPQLGCTPATTCERARANSKHVNSQSANVLLLPNQKKSKFLRRAKKIIVTIQKNYFKATAI